MIDIRLNIPIMILVDLDTYDCPLALIKDWLGNESLNTKIIFRIACTEAESWLMADRNGFATYFGIKEENIPKPFFLNKLVKDNTELEFPLKPSLFLMRELIPKSKKKDIIEKLTPKKGAKKGPLFNEAIIPFIKYVWNINEASINSYSLRKTIERVKSYHL